MRLPGVFRGTRRSDAIVSVAAIVSLALGIGAATAIFTLVNSLLFRPLPVLEPERLVTITSATAAQGHYTEQYSYATFEAIRRRAIFDDVLAWSTTLLAVEGEPQPVSSMWVSGNFFSMLGVPSPTGRTISPADDVANGGTAGLVAMISHRLWQRRFQGAPDVVGRPLRLERTVVTIVGVTPPGFAGVDVGRAFDLFLPANIQPAIETGVPLDRHAPFLWLMSRRGPEQSLDAATAAMRTAQSDIRTASLPPQWVGDFLKDPFILESSASGTSVLSNLRERYSGPLFALLTVATLVLGVACTNVANLFLARGAARRTELTLRLALGASRWRLVRQLLGESLVFAAAGVLLGVLAAMWASRALVTQLAAEAQLAAEVQPLVMDLPLDWRVVTFASMIAAAAVTIFGLAPAVRATRIAPIEALKDNGRDHTSGGRTRALNVFLVAQVTLALLLVLTAGLFARTFRHVTDVPLGFNRARLLLGTIAAPMVPVADRNPFYHRLIDAVEAVPGVMHTGGSVGGPLTTFGDTGIPLAVSGARTSSNGGTMSHIADITPGWMAAYGMRLRAGRDIAAGDVLGSLPVMIVNESFVRRFFPGDDVLGRTVTLTANPGRGDISLGPKTIVGIVADTVHDSVREPATPTIYAPLAQRAFPLYYPAFFLAVRPAGGSLAEVSHRATAALRAVDPALRITFQPMADRVDAMLTQDRLVARLSAFGGALALLLAAVGLYGVTAYAVACRRAELGIRMALGSAPARVVRLVLWQTLRPVSVGIVIGSAISVWTGQLVGSMLYGVTPRDPLVMLSAVLTLAGVALAAAWLPAYRASLTDPSSALRRG